MMRAAYIGILTPGTTSRMRADRLRALTPEADWQGIDTDAPMRQSQRWWRSLAFRTKSGPAVTAINSAVEKALAPEGYDLVWIDKGVFLRHSLLKKVRAKARRLVHFTPDTAFHANRSRHFESGMGDYDLLVTTKSFEADDYKVRGGTKLHLTTQGYDSSLHRPAADLGERRREALFVGLAEPDRLGCVDRLLAAGVPVRLAGKGWGELVSRHERNALLSYEGDGVFGEAYVKLLSQSWVGLGLLSKRFPELHTTRTFEIPACGAVLATERTVETAEYFDDHEALFFRDYDDMAVKLAALFAGPVEALEKLARAGRQRVLSDGRDYDSILQRVLADERVRL